MSKPYIFLKIDCEYVQQQFNIRIYLEDVPTLRFSLFNCGIPFTPSSEYTANLAYSINEITHDFTTMTGTITGDYCEFEIPDDFFDATGDYYCQIYLTSDTKQITIGHGMIRVLESLFT